MKKWTLSPQADLNAVNNISQAIGTSRLVSEILVSRGYSTPEKASEFISEGELSSPFLIKDMDVAVGIINNAIDEGQVICIYGDYDCDGITSTVMLYQYLTCVGADVYYYIPETDLGYGLHESIVRELKEDGVDLIITVDNGISAVEEAALIKELGMSLIITDHHQPGDVLPEADAIINPHRKDCTSPFKNLCGAGVVLKLIAAMDDGDYETTFEQFGDLAAIATIADVMKLEGENRYIVRNGLNCLAKTENYGIQALMEAVSLDENSLTATNVAFRLAPKINAARRCASPKIAVELLLSEDPEEATELARELVSYNNMRKELEEKIYNDICDIINADPSILNERVLVFAGEGWHHGVIGIVSAGITERYGKPSIIISIEGENARGSARSVGDFAIFRLLDYCDEVLQKHGGHMGAGGFSLKTSDIDRFRQMIAEYARINHNSMPRAEISVDKILGVQDITVDAIKSLSVLEPFGEGNPSPVFAIPNAEIVGIASLSEGKHCKVTVSYLGMSLQILMFRYSPDALPFVLHDKVNFLVSAGLSEFRGTEQISLIMLDCLKNGIVQQKYFNAKDAYEKYMLGEGVSDVIIPIIKPERSDVAVVYKALTENPRHIEDIYGKVFSDKMNFFKFRIAIDALCELGLARLNHFESRVALVPSAPKADLGSSAILQKIKAL